MFREPVFTVVGLNMLLFPYTSKIQLVNFHNLKIQTFIVTRFGLQRSLYLACAMHPGTTRKTLERVCGSILDFFL